MSSIYSQQPIPPVYPTTGDLPLSGAGVAPFAFVDADKRHYMFSDGAWFKIPNASELTTRRTFVNGLSQNGTPKTGDTIEWIDSVTVSGGNAVFYLTSDHTSTGTAICSAIFPVGVDVHTVDSSASFARGVATVAGNLKSVTVPVNKQILTGVVVLSINVLGSVAYSATPNGTVVNATIIGIAA
jgi:hypothetical protein